MVTLEHPPLRWVTEQLRFTAFTINPELRPKIRDCWRALSDGQEPDTVTDEVSKQRALCQGPIDGVRLAVSVQGTRLDILQSRRPEESPPAPIDEGLKQFSRIVQRWCKRPTAQIQRLAFGAILLQAVHPRIEGCRDFLGQHLPVRMADVGLQDFVLRFNRPRTSQAVNGLHVNQVLTWSIAKVQTVTVGPSSSTSATGFAAQLSIDVNSDAERRDLLDPGSLSRLFQEFAGLGAGIARKGGI